MISIKQCGGLGNQLFQIAFLEYASKISKKKLYISTPVSPPTHHTSADYFSSIFKNWKSEYLRVNNSISIQEEKSRPYEDWKTILLSRPGNIMLEGYFQNYKFVNEVRDIVLPKLSFNVACVEKYAFIKECFFIHIRGTDYINNPHHYIDLGEYYKRCIELCEGENFVVFSNDIPHVNKILGNHKYHIVKTNEIDTLYLMSQAKGGICANSTFSWWGAYLTPNRRIFFPKKMLPKNFHDGNYHLPGWIII